MLEPPAPPQSSETPHWLPLLDTESENSAKALGVQGECKVPGESMNLAWLLYTFTQTSSRASYDICGLMPWSGHPGRFSCLFPNSDSLLHEEKQAGTKQPVSAFFCLSRKHLEQDIKAALSTQPDILLPDARLRAGTRTSLKQLGAGSLRSRFENPSRVTSSLALTSPSFSPSCHSPPS